MKLRAFLFLLTFPLFCFSQDTIRISKIDTLLPFFGTRPIRLAGYENRVVLFNSKNPLYVMTTYEDVKNKNFEYFRIDSSKYLRYEFFRSDKGSSNEGLKSAGVVKVIEKIMDTTTTGVRHIGGNEKHTREIHYYKGFSKEGIWTEYDDSLFYHRFWTGKYSNNKRVGLWSNYIYAPNDDRLIEEIDYDKDSTVKIYSANLAACASLDTLTYYFTGRWTLGCEDRTDRRMLLDKCRLYEGRYGDDCNSRFGAENFYEFSSNGSFLRQKGETCNKFLQSGAKGNWRFVRLKNDLLLEITLLSKSKIKFKVIYFDREGNMVADRQ